RPRHSGRHIVVSVVGSLGPRLSRGCALGCRLCAPRCTRDRPRATLMYALGNATIFTRLHCGSYTARAEVEELLVLADEKSASFWKALGPLTKSCLLALEGNNSDAIQMLTSGIVAYRLTGATIHVPLYLSYLARAHAELGQIDDAWRCIDEAMTAAEAAKQKVWEAEVYRTAGEIALKVSDWGEARAETYFERARNRAPTASQVLGTARSDEHHATLA